MIKINGTTITSAALFREHFDLEAVAKIVNQVVKDDTLFTQENDVAVQQLLRRALDEGVEGWTWECDGHFASVRAGEEEEPLRLVCLEVEEWQTLTSLSVRAWTVLLLHELAHRSLSWEKLKELSGGPQEQTCATQADTLMLHAGQELVLTLFEPVDELTADLHTVKIFNGSDLKGYAKVVVGSPEGMVLDIVRLGNQECLFANFLGDRLVELLPRLVTSFSHCNYLTYEGGEATVGRYLFASEETFVYHAAHCRGITQFCPDEEKGFVGVADGQLLLFTSLLSAMDCDFELLEGERFVKAVLSGRMLLALTSRGRTFSNVGKCTLARRRDIVSIGTGPDYSLYALTSKGKLLVSGEHWNMPLENVYTVGTLSTKEFFVKTRDGYTYCHSGEKSTAVGKRIKTETGLELRLNPVDGSLMCKGADLKLAHEVDDFALFDDTYSRAWEQVLVYYQSHVEHINAEDYGR